MSKENSKKENTVFLNILISLVPSMEHMNKYYRCIAGIVASINIYRIVCVMQHSERIINVESDAQSANIN